MTESDTQPGQATVTTTCIAALPHRCQIRLSGPDWAPFLKGLCTAHIDTLIRSSAQNTPLDMAYGAFLRPQGKMYADCLLLSETADEIKLDVAVSARDEVLAKLTMYRLRAKVTIEALDTPVFVAFGGPPPPGFIRDRRSAIIGADVAFAYAPQTANSDLEAWRDFRFLHSLPDAGEDFAADELYAIDANLDLLDAIDFHKGCYVGQELTSRMKRRGQIKNRILPLTHFGKLSRGAEVLNGERKFGEVLASTDGVSLALIRLDRISQGLTCDATAVTLEIPDWIRAHVEISQT